jgi:uncharacterized membrane protein
MEALTIIFLVLAVFGIIVSIHYGRKSSKFKKANKTLHQALQQCKQTCSNKCNFHIHNR